MYLVVVVCAVEKKIICLSVCLFSAVAAACRVSGNLIATFLVVLAINFHGETKFSAENLFAKAVTHNHKKILLLPT